MDSAPAILEVALSLDQRHAARAGLRRPPQLGQVVLPEAGQVDLPRADGSQDDVPAAGTRVGVQTSQRVQSGTRNRADLRCRVRGRVAAHSMQLADQIPVRRCSRGQSCTLPQGE